MAALSVVERNSSFRAGTRQTSSFISHRAFKESQLRSAGETLIFADQHIVGAGGLGGMVKSVEAWN